MSQVRDCIRIEFWTASGDGTPMMTLHGIRGGTQYVELHGEAIAQSVLLKEIPRLRDALTVNPQLLKAKGDAS